MNQRCQARLSDACGVPVCVAMLMLSEVRHCRVRANLILSSWAGTRHATLAALAHPEEDMRMQRRLSFDSALEGQRSGTSRQGRGSGCCPESLVRLWAVSALSLTFAFFASAFFLFSLSIFAILGGAMPPLRKVTDCGSIFVEVRFGRCSRPTVPYRNCTHTHKGRVLWPPHTRSKGLATHALESRRLVSRDSTPQAAARQVLEVR
ncbi:hypothetical protein BCV70DRAFT_26429 [Testicularia cyperi]|uniref:Uncharacterized protein n=1 Tax=Testicularia cyperi TaxID=1882483 RepID=A0A317XLN5_9BASI|nr:hypothetical protein BCV70DRAFT_26429 [Testicularia cyperi]